MSSLVGEVTAAILDLAELTGPDASPDPVSVLGLKGKLVGLRLRLGREKNAKFSAKQQYYLKRKIEQSTQFRLARFDPTGKKLRSAADAEHDAILAVGDELHQENQAAAELDDYLTLLQSLDVAITHAMQVVSFYGKAERSA